MQRRTPIAVVALAATLCASVGHAQTLPPRRKARLLAWLKDGAYRGTYTPEPAVHASEVPGAHGAYVLTYYGPILVEDLRAARGVFRPGAAMVKELYREAGAAPVGYSVMRKLRRRSGATGQGWLFYETFDGTNDGAIFGRGKAVCVGCHRSGADYLRSAFRP